jgi:hypothetical protein
VRLSAFSGALGLWTPGAKECLDLTVSEDGFDGGYELGVRVSVAGHDLGVGRSIDSRLRNCFS